MSDWIERIQTCLQKAEAEESNLDSTILNMDGMSGRCTRHFYNNLCSYPDVRYLEIGTWKGSSICSAMYQNNMTCVCIDNWSELGGPREEFISNFDQYKGQNHASFIEGDCWKVLSQQGADAIKMLLDSSKRFNVYLYDGSHEESSHYKAVHHFLHLMEDEFVFLVDDWNWPFVRKGTEDAIRDFNLEIIWNHHIRTSTDDQQPWDHTYPYLGKQSRWHNGIGIFVLRK